MKRFLIAFFLAFGMANAVMLFSNTTINSSLTQNSFFELYPAVCVFDVASNNTYCSANVTVFENNTAYYNDTIYPQCFNFSNHSVNLTYADFGTAEDLDYQCKSGEWVFAPEKPEEECVVPTPSVNPIKIDETLSCKGKKEYKHVDMAAQQYIEVDVVDCENPPALIEFDNFSEIEKETKCQPFYDKGYRDKVCQDCQSSITGSAVGSDENSAGLMWVFTLLFLVGAVGVYLYSQHKLPWQRTAEEPADMLKM